MKLFISALIIGSFTFLNAEILSVKEAFELTKKELDNGYLSNKESCDLILTYVNNQIKKTIASNQTNSMQFNYNEDKNHNGWDGWYFRTTCQANIFKYQLIKRGYSLQVQNGKSDNHIIISW